MRQCFSLSPFYLVHFSQNKVLWNGLLITVTAAMEYIYHTGNDVGLNKVCYIEYSCF